MKKVGILILLIMSNTAFANEQDFQEELQLPKAHYNQAQKKIVVEVATDERNPQNFHQQERIINTLQEEAKKPVEVKEVTATTDEINN
jgi:hypothetical protein